MLAAVQVLAKIKDTASVGGNASDPPCRRVDAPARCRARRDGPSADDGISSDARN